MSRREQYATGAEQSHGSSTARNPPQLVALEKIEWTSIESRYINMFMRSGLLIIFL